MWRCRSPGADGWLSFRSRLPSGLGHLGAVASQHVERLLEQKSHGCLVETDSKQEIKAYVILTHSYTVMSVTGLSCDLKWWSLVDQDQGLPVKLQPGLMVSLVLGGGEWAVESPVSSFPSVGFPVWSTRCHMVSA